MSQEPIISPLLGNRPLYIDEKTTTEMMRRVSQREMIEMAEKPDPEGRNLLFEELNRANEEVKSALGESTAGRGSESTLTVNARADPDQVKKALAERRSVRYLSQHSFLGLWCNIITKQTYGCQSSEAMALLYFGLINVTA